MTDALSKNDRRESEAAAAMPEDEASPSVNPGEDAIERRQRFFDNQVDEETLQDHLERQIPVSDIAPGDYALAEMLIGNLNGDGYFDGSLPDVVMVSGESEAHVLEILAALVTGLSGAGLDCSLAIPRSVHFPAMTLRGEAGGGVEALLLHIAGYECLYERVPDTEDVMYLPSEFPTDAASRTRVNYLLTRNGGVLPKRLMVRIPEGKCTVLCLENTEAAHRVGLPAVSLHSLKRGGGAR
jgi:hypothetical protein